MDDSPAPEPRTPEEAARRRERVGERELRRLHRKIESLADMAEPKAAGDLLLGIARQVVDVAGLSARHTRKVEAKVTPSSDVDSWFEGLAKK